MSRTKGKWTKAFAMGIFAMALASGAGSHDASAALKATIKDAQSLGHWEKNGDKRTYVMNQPELLQSESSTMIKKRATTLPTQYSLVTAGRSTSVKNQGSTGTCWAFGPIASLESNLITTKHATSSIDLSERQLAWFGYNSGSTKVSASKYAGNDFFGAYDPYNAGGERRVSVAALARWYGAADESKAKFNTSSMSGLSSSLKTTSQIHLKDAVYLPEVNKKNSSGTWTSRSTSSVASIKQYLYSKGAVSVGIYADSYLNLRTGGYNKINEINNTSSYYCNSKTATPNHEVTIVGWDDNYSKDNFASKPSSNGAWIVKNSWGTGVVGNGYFYLSYEDKTFSEPTGFIAENTTYKSTGSKHTYGNIYQYDGIGMGDGAFATTSRINAANIYTARNNETVRGIGTYTFAANSKVAVRIYTGVTSGKPMSGTLKYSHTFTLENAGYHTIDLGSSYFALPKGTRYSVVFTTYYTSGSKTYYTVPFETEGINFTASANIAYTSTQSYMDEGSLNSNGWKSSGGKILQSGNLYAYLGNAMMKVYTNTRNQTISTSATTYKKTIGQSSFNVNAKRTSGIGSLSYSSSDKSIATVTSKGTVKMKKTGKVTIYVKVSGNKEYPSVTKKLTVYVRPKTPTLKSASTSSKKTLKVKWSKKTSITGYRVDLATNDKFTKGKKIYMVKSKSATSKIIRSLKSKKTYYIRVRAYIKSHGTNVYSTSSKIKKRTIK